MKPKDFNKKLRLNKKTIAHLIDDELKFVLGGDSDPCVFTAPLCPKTAGCEITPNCVTTGQPYTVCHPTCATYTGGPNSDPCCETC